MVTFTVSRDTILVVLLVLYGLAMFANGFNCGGKHADARNKRDKEKENGGPEHKRA